MKPPRGRNESIREIGAILIQGWLHLRGTRAPEIDPVPHGVGSNSLAMRAGEEPMSSEHDEVPIAFSQRQGRRTS